MIVDDNDIAWPPITEFKGRWGFLSNFYPAKVEYGGLLYATSEHAFQAQKSHDDKDRRKIRDASSPGVAKQLGKTVKLRPDWEDVKVAVMKAVVMAKFEQNSSLRTWLLGTGEAHIEEGNWHKDREWGVCPPRGEGKNLLGKILEEVRAELRTKAA